MWAFKVQKRGSRSGWSGGRGVAGQQSGQGLMNQKALSSDFGGYFQMIILNHRRDKTDRQTDRHQQKWTKPSELLTKTDHLQYPWIRVFLNKFLISGLIFNLQKNCKDSTQSSHISHHCGTFVKARKKTNIGTSLLTKIQTLGLALWSRGWHSTLPMQGLWVRSLVREMRCCMPKQTNKNVQTLFGFHQLFHECTPCSRIQPGTTLHPSAVSPCVLWSVPVSVSLCFLRSFSVLRSPGQVFCIMSFNQRLRTSLVVQRLRICLPVQENMRHRFDPWVGKIPWRRATHSSILAWRIPWTEKPGRLQSMELQRVGHDWHDLAHTHLITYWWGQMRGR